MIGDLQRDVYLLFQHIHNGHVDSWSRVHGSNWGGQRGLMAYKISEGVECWLMYSSVELWHSECHLFRKYSSISCQDQRYWCEVSQYLTCMWTLLLEWIQLIHT